MVFDATSSSSMELAIADTSIVRKCCTGAILSLFRAGTLELVIYLRNIFPSGATKSAPLLMTPHAAMTVCRQFFGILERLHFSSISFT